MEISAIPRLSQQPVYRKVIVSLYVTHGLKVVSCTSISPAQGKGQGAGLHPSTLPLSNVRSKTLTT